MAELFIAADDFTGALDTGVKLAAQGISARVVSGCESIGPCPETVLVANLDSRHLERDAAFEATYSACNAAFEAGARCLYIKTDSGLRGNIGAALEAAARAAKSKVVFAPAYPALNRRTENGVHMIGDVPVTKSVFGRDLLNPVRHDFTRDIIREQTALKVYGAEEAVPEAGPHIELLELNTDEDMLCYARAHAKSGIKAYAGCAGFAQVLGTLLGLTRGKPRAVRIRLPLAVLSASLSAVNFEQMRRGGKAGLASFAFTDVLSREPDLETLAACTLEKTPGVLIESARTKEEADALSARGEKMGLDAAARANRIAFNMGRAAKALTDAGFQGTLCLFGGDTVSAALAALGCRGLSPAGEIEPGVVISKAYLPDGEMAVVTKSGSFGSANVIERLLKRAEETE
ncbi:MAG: four-carbon acid sugar kinase family protein [Clostridia bacterium]|nr:four-carbon acid sugar kinase family protein [Clostridia bacterium]